MIADITRNKRLNQLVTKLFIRGRNRSINTAFVIKSY